MSAAPLRTRPETDECRCLCGSLIARVVAGGVELKCRRCKRTLVVEVPVGVPEGRAVVPRVRGVPDSG